MELLIKSRYHFGRQTGFTLVEAMVSVAVLLVMTVGAVSANRLTTSSVTINQLRTQANTLAVEAMEIVLSLRADNFLGLSYGTYHPVFDGTKWTLASGPQTIGKFTRSVEFSPVQRSLVCFTAVCDIVSQGGIVDGGSMMTEVKVAWLQSGETRETKLDSLISYWR